MDTQQTEPRVMWHATLHGLDPADIQLRRDDVNDAWFLDLDLRGDVSIRIDPKYGADQLRRDLDGLMALAEAVTELAVEITHRLDGQDAA